MDHICKLIDDMPADPSILSDMDLKKTIKQMLNCGECLIMKLEDCKVESLTALENVDFSAMEKIADKVEMLIRKISEVKKWVSKAVEENNKRLPNHVQQMILCARNAHNN